MDDKALDFIFFFYFLTFYNIFMVSLDKIMFEIKIKILN